MNHLSNEQLTLLVYHESGVQTSNWNEHLIRCPDCQDRFQQLSELEKELTSFTVVTPEFDLNVQAIMAADAGQLAEPQAILPARLTFGSTFLVASIMLLIGGISFLFGTNYQSRQTTELIDAKVASALDKFGNDTEISQQIFEDEIAKRIGEHFVGIKNSLAEQNEKISEQNYFAWQNMESRLRQMLSEQRALRKDLQTLAVNAEGEISLAHRDIRRIDEFVSLLLPSDQ